MPDDDKQGFIVNGEGVVACCNVVSFLSPCEPVECNERSIGFMGCDAIVQWFRGIRNV